MAMTIIRKLTRLAFVTLAYLNIATAEPTDSGELEFSEAETKLWLTDQLQSVSEAMELIYRFEKSGSLEAGFSDEVKFVINKLNGDGTKAGLLNFFTGERNFPVPSVDATTINPVIKVYLQGDVYEMNRLTDPDGAAGERWRYFQRRIKFALAESATVIRRSFTFADREWNGYEIYFQPYVNDPKRDSFERFAEKTYTVIVCDELPGYLYRIETTVPAQHGSQPLVREVLQLSRVVPLS